MIDKNPEISAPKLNLFSIQGKDIELSFSGDRISSDGGLLLLREVDNQLNLLSSASKCILDERDKRYIDHSVKELLKQRVFQIAAGYEDCNDCNDLREDMIFKLCAGRLPQSEHDLASQPTMSRLENTVTKTDLFRLGKFLVDNFINSYSTVPSVIILDCDDTNNDIYGQQELALFNNFYNEHCYMPIHIYEGLSGKLVTTILRPGRRNKQANIARLLQKLVLYLRVQWPKTKIIVRGDGHFASQDFMDWTWKKPNLGFITGLAGNAKLHELSKVTVESAQREFNQYQNPVKRYHSFMYKAGSWENYQRVIVKVEVNSMGTNIRYIVTDLNDFRARDLYEKGYCARCSMELRIKDHKLYLKSDRSSCTKFTANQFRLFLHSLAYILIHTLQKQVLKGSEYANATMKTIQLKIIKTAAWVKEMKTKIRIELPQCCPTRNEQIKGFEMMMLLRT
jgi:Transposase DDE domain group 1